MSQKVRLRRLRYNKTVRDLFEDTHLRPQDLIYPIFVCEGKNIKNEIKSMPGQYQVSVDRLPSLCNKLIELNIKSVILFGVPDKKDDDGKVAQDDNGIVQRAVKEIKKTNNEILVIVDVCHCQYTLHGHCGTIDKGDVDNDKTVTNLGLQAVSLARAGADVIAPSDMMDGRVNHIRNILDKNNFEKLPIFSYSVKYASAFYGPFRDAAENTPQHGDRKSYQMNYKNSLEAMREAETDINEGADALIVKPAMSYLDIIYRIKSKYSIPVIAYNVSGEYSMAHSAVDKNWIDKQVIFEILTSMKRAGANAIITYHAIEVAEYLNEN
ncbi:MAG: porphobilinogen synthase [Bacteroidota bacterium]|nr:porphobilinogen synthase [Bacteroidota bacterium]|tara:strand:+ start:2901 stop:3872 length:972 start_codon:yes stop_codon:yes gene_type:complete